MRFFVLMEDMKIEEVEAESQDEAIKKAGLLNPDCLVMLICPTRWIAQEIRDDYLKEVPVWN